MKNTLRRSKVNEPAMNALPKRKASELHCGMHWSDSVYGLVVCGPHECASGVYLYRMTAGKYGATKKLVLVK
jgi:hypothetical protein